MESLAHRAPSRRHKTKQAILALVEQAARLGDADAQAYLAAHTTRSRLPPLELFAIAPPEPKR